MFEGWDEDLLDALRFAGVQQRFFSVDLISHLSHDDEKRTEFHDESNRRVTHMVNRIYRSAKWDSATLNGKMLTYDQRRTLYHHVKREIAEAMKTPGKRTVRILAGRMMFTSLALTCDRVLEYTMKADDQSKQDDYRQLKS